MTVEVCFDRYDAGIRSIQVYRQCSYDCLWSVAIKWEVKRTDFLWFLLSCELFSNVLRSAHKYPPATSNKKEMSKKESDWDFLYFYLFGFDTKIATISSASGSFRTWLLLDALSVFRCLWCRWSASGERPDMTAAHSARPDYCKHLLSESRLQPFARQRNESLSECRGSDDTQSLETVSGGWESSARAKATFL